MLMPQSVASFFQMDAYAWDGCGNNGDENRPAHIFRTDGPKKSRKFLPASEKGV